ncbi:MAG TPA: TolC family protein [Spirochaetota bacterium]|nr:TolC family protein [Spirochaetota bacterium]
MTEYIRSRYKIIASVLLLILLSVSHGIAEENSKHAEKISYKYFIDSIKQQLPELRKNRLQVEKAKNTVYGAGSTEDIYLSGETGYSKSDILSQGTTTGKKDYSSKIGLTKKIARTGTEISTGAAYNRTEYGNDGSTAYHYPSVYVKFNQSLLKNAFGTVDRYAVNNAKMQYEIEKLREIESNKTDMNYYKKLYFTWIEYREELKMINSSISTSKKLAENIKNRFRSGMVNTADLYSSAAVVLKYQIAYEELKTEMNAMESELAIFFKELKDENKIPDDTEFFSFFTNSLASEYPAITFDRTANAEIYRLTKNSLKYTADVSENKLLPQLDLVGEYTKKSENETFTKSAENLNSTDYYLGFSFSYPLQNTENSSKLEETKLSIEEINSEYSISQNSYNKSLDAIVSRYKDSRNLLTLREKRIETLEEKYRFELQKYQQSQLDLETLINTSIDITNEKISLIQLKKQIIENYIDYSDLTEKIE